MRQAEPAVFSREHRGGGIERSKMESATTEMQKASGNSSNAASSGETVTTTSPQVKFAPSPGVYRNVPAAEYHAWPFASNHRLGDLAQSPAHCLDRMRHPDPPTGAMILGTAAHDLILEHHDWVTVSDQCAHPVANAYGRCQSTGKHLKRGLWYCGVHMKADGEELGKAVLTRDSYEVLQAMDRAVNAHKEASRLLDQRTHTELSIVWKDQATGATVKMRADGVIARRDGICFDLKTTADDASRKSFEREIWNLGYYRQAALYLDGLNAAGIPCDSYCLIVVEKAAPFGVAVYEIVDEALAIGRAENAKALKIWAKCMETGIWPGYSDEIQCIGLPKWALRQVITEADL